MPSTPETGPAFKFLQFRLPTHELEAFHDLAYAAFGMKHGAKTELFRLMWQAYEDAQAAGGSPVDEQLTRAALDERTKALTQTRGG